MIFLGALWLGKAQTLPIKVMAKSLQEPGSVNVEVQTRVSCRRKGTDAPRSQSCHLRILELGVGARVAVEGDSNSLGLAKEALARPPYSQRLILSPSVVGCIS